MFARELREREITRARSTAVQKRSWVFSARTTARTDQRLVCFYGESPHERSRRVSISNRLICPKVNANRATRRAALPRHEAEDRRPPRATRRRRADSLAG